MSRHILLDWGLPVVVVLADEGFVESWKQREYGKLAKASNVMVLDATQETGEGEE